ncbi:MAG: mercuric reductase [Myxococcota bacterium]
MSVVPSIRTTGLRTSLPEDRGQDLILPDDAHNRALVANVHPPAWVNPEPTGCYNLVVVGAGTAGLVSAAGAAGLGAKVALVERHLLGGDCLNFGCVPSKGILRSAHAVHDVRTAASFGVQVDGVVRVDFGAAMARMRGLRAGISRNDSVHRLTALGVDVYLGEARFLAGETLEVGGCRLRFKRAVLATGARAAGLPVPGLAEAGYLTNETVFSLTELPRRLVVIGAGPIGCELAQAFRRFGSEVTVVSLDERLLPREDEDAAAIVTARFEKEGVNLALGARLVRVAREGASKVVAFDRGRGEEQVAGDEVLVAVGRAPNVEALGLEAAGIEFDRFGVKVDDRLRTTNRRVYAAGDICSVHKFTHAADAMARVVLQNALFFGRKKASALRIPWCTYTDPEVAHVGLYEKEAVAKGLDVRTHTVELAEVDRAILDGEAEGFARVHVDARSGHILGATLVARHAGDMLGEVVLAMNEGHRIDALSRAIAPYPTQGEVWKRLGDAHQRLRLTPRLKRWLARWFSLGR